MKEFWTKLVLETIFIIGSIMTLYCLYILWAKKSFKKAREPEE